MKLAATVLLTLIAASAADSQVTVTRAGSQPVEAGPADRFTGKVRNSGRFEGTAPSRVMGSTVTFAPGARTAWHTHPLGQALIVTEGEGLVGYWHGRVQRIAKGDTVWIAPGVKHWHGATPTSALTHIAIVERLDGKAADWTEHVSDAQYQVR